MGFYFFFFLIFFNYSSIILSRFFDFDLSCFFSGRSLFISIHIHACAVPHSQSPIFAQRFPYCTERWKCLVSWKLQLHTRAILIRLICVCVWGKGKQFSLAPIKCMQILCRLFTLTLWRGKIHLRCVECALALQLCLVFHNTDNNSSSSSSTITMVHPYQ